MPGPPHDREQAAPRRDTGPHGKRHPLTRDPGLAPASLGEIARGIETLAILGLIRYATNEQLQATFAEAATPAGGHKGAGAGYAANRALRELFDGGWLDRIPVLIPREAYRRDDEGSKESYVNVLAARGIEALKGHYLRRQRGETFRFEKKNIPRRRQPFIHPYGVVEWYFMARAATRARGWCFDRWIDDKELALRQRKGDAAVAPDGFFTIATPGEGAPLPHFVALDLGTETVASDDDTIGAWLARFRGYDTYLRQVGADASFGDPAARIVLIATTAEEQLATILDAARRGAAGDTYWVTTFERLHREGLFGSIWQVPTADALRSLLDRFAAER